MTPKLTSLLSGAEIAAVRAPIEAALTFPSRCYTSSAFYELEIAAIYGRRWTAVCFDFDVPNTGDVYPTELCGMPLVAVRDASGRIRVFHNICPYDGCPVVLNPRRGLQQLIAPYHGWVYDLDGRLLQAPYWNGRAQHRREALASHAVNLVEVPAGVFLHTVFVDVSGQAGALRDAMAPIQRHFGHYALNRLSVGLGGDGGPLVSARDRRTNWKTFFENAALNVLHERFVHDFYSLSPDIPRVRPDGTAIFGSVVDGLLLAMTFRGADFGATYPAFGLEPIGTKGYPEVHSFATFYPNFYLSFAGEYIEITYVLPDGPGRVVEREAFLMEPHSAADPALAARRRYLANIYLEAANEDAAITEAIQRARSSPVFTQHFYAPFWDTLHYALNQLILADLERHS